MNVSQGKLLGENLIELCKRIAASTPPLYIVRDGRPEPISSSILVKWDTSHFLVTTGHTLRYHNPNDLGVIFNRKFLRMGGAYFTTNSKEIDDDKIDLGVYHLSDEFLPQVGSNFTFFDLKSFDFDHVDSDDDVYLVVGYPNTRTKIRPDEHKIEIRPFLFKTDLDKASEVYQKLCLREDVNFLLNYTRKRITDLLPGNIVQGPLPKGLSGCGVWKISDPLTHDLDSISFYPTGIIIEYSKTHHVLIGTRMRVITDCLRQVYSDNIPASKILRVNIKQDSLK